MDTPITMSAAIHGAIYGGTLSIPASNIFGGSGTMGGVVGNRNGDTGTITIKLKPRSSIFKSNQIKNHNAEAVPSCVRSGGISSPCPQSPVSGFKRNRNDKPTKSYPLHSQLNENTNAEEVVKASHPWIVTVKMLDIVLAPSGNSLITEESTNKEGLIPICHSGYRCEEVCSVVRCLCDAGHSKLLYTEFVMRVRAFLELHIRALCDFVPQPNDAENEEDSSNDDEFAICVLQKIVLLWSNYIHKISSIATVFMYLDRRFVLQETPERSIVEVGIRLFRTEALFSIQHLLQIANKGFLILLGRDRAADNLHVSLDMCTPSTNIMPSTSVRLLRSYCDLSLAIDIYFSTLEPLVVQDAAKTFTNIGCKLVSSSVEGISSEIFFETVDSIMLREKARLFSFLDHRTKVKIDEVLQAKLIKPHSAAIFERDFPRLVIDGKLDHIARSFRIMCMRFVKQKEVVRKTFKFFVEKKGDDFIASRLLEENLIENLILLRKTGDLVIDSCFVPGHTEEFRLVMKMAFERCVRKKEERTAELLTRHLDQVLSGGFAPEVANREKGIPQDQNLQLPQQSSSFVFSSPLLRGADSNEESIPSLFVNIPSISSNEATCVVSGLSDTPNTSRASKARSVIARAEEELEKALCIFAYLPSKDLFEALFIRDFARRILSGRSASEWLERFVIRRLKATCGHAIASKLEGMMKDLALSETLTKEFLEENSNSAVATVDGSFTTEGTTFQVLSQSYWSYYDSFVPNPTTFPTSLANAMSRFNEYYCNKRFKSRHLKWVPSLATCTVKALFEKSNGGVVQEGVSKDIRMSLLQGLIMTLCFNSDNIGKEHTPSMTLEEITKTVCDVDESGVPKFSLVGIHNSTSGAVLKKYESRVAAMAKTIGLGVSGQKLSREEYAVQTLIICALMSLSAPNLKLLLREKSNIVKPKDEVNSIYSSEFNKNDVFKLNRDFTHKQRYIRVNQMQLRGPQDDTLSHTTANEASKSISDRPYLIDTSLIKILKSTQSIKHDALVKEVSEVISGRFVVAVTDIKKRLELLIDRGFIGRDVDDPNVYFYKA